MFLGATENPSSLNSLAKSINSELVYRHSGASKKYFLAVVGVSQRCEYVLSVASSSNSIVHLEKGKIANVKLSKGQYKYFFLKQNADKFKIFAMNQYGDLKLHLNRSYISDSDVSIHSLDYKSFTTTSQTSNLLAVSSKHSQFCKNCNYFLAVEALRPTLTTLFLSDPETIVPLVPGKLFRDIL